MGPTITREHIEALIASSTFIDVKLGEKTTVVCCRLPNGFEIIEASACVDPANYNHDMGVGICKRRIVDRVWALEGYRLQCEVATAAQESGADGTPAYGADERIELLCSAYAIAERRGQNTRWPEFLESVRKCLAEHGRNGVTPRTYRDWPADA